MGLQLRPYSSHYDGTLCRKRQDDLIPFSGEFTSAARLLSAGRDHRHRDRSGWFCGRAYS